MSGTHGWVYICVGNSPCSVDPRAESSGYPSHLTVCSITSRTSSMGPSKLCASSNPTAQCTLTSCAQGLSYIAQNADRGNQVARLIDVWFAGAPARLYWRPVHRNGSVSHRRIGQECHVRRRRGMIAGSARKSQLRWRKRCQTPASSRQAGRQAATQHTCPPPSRGPPPPSLPSPASAAIQPASQPASQPGERRAPLAVAASAGSRTYYM